jgi:hypothetical protein
VLLHDVHGYKQFIKVEHFVSTGNFGSSKRGNLAFIFTQLKMSKLILQIDFPASEKRLHKRSLKWPENVNLQLLFISLLEKKRTLQVIMIFMYNPASVYNLSWLKFSSPCRSNSFFSLLPEVDEVISLIWRGLTDQGQLE